MIAAVYARKSTALHGKRQALFHPAGTALVTHAGPDDDETDPAGNSRARIACGEIVR